MIPLSVSQKNVENISPSVINLNKPKNSVPVSSLMPVSSSVPLSEMSLNNIPLPSKPLEPVSELSSNIVSSQPVSELASNMLPPSQLSQVPPSPSRMISQVPPSPSRIISQVPSSPSRIISQVPSSPSRMISQVSQVPSSPSRMISQVSQVPSSPSRMVSQVPSSPSRIISQVPPSSRMVSQVPSSSRQVSGLEENMMKLGNRPETVYKKRIDVEMAEKGKETVNTGLTKVAQTSSTAVFGNFEGDLPNQSIENALLERKFVPIDKILTKDAEGNIMCNFIKIRDYLGRIAFVELDTCDGDMGYISVAADTPILTVTSDASVVPYSLKVGTYEASKEDIYGIGFECDNTICVMSRKNNSLAPVETVFNYSKGSRKLGKNDVGILNNHPIPYPIVKLSEILKNPQQVEKSIGVTYARLREASFNSCEKELCALKKLASDLNNEIARYEKISQTSASEISQSIGKLEDMNNKYECKGVSCKKDEDKLKAIRFNLQKRNELLGDYISLCHSMRDRMNRMAVLKDEIRDLNNYSQELFHGLNSVFTE